MRTLETDLIIAGGGLVGASLAHALAGRGLRVAVAEAVPHGDAAQPSFDERVIALAYGSARILDGLGLWEEVAGEAMAIQRVHVSDCGHFGAARISAREQGVPALGYVLAARHLGEVLQRSLGAGEVQLLAPALVVAVSAAADRVEVTLEAGEEEVHVTGALLVAADGGESTVRTAAGIGVRSRDYGQSAVIANVQAAGPHGGVAHERFTDTGPLALLPMTGDRFSVVWTVPHRDGEAVAGQSDEAFLAGLQERFGHRGGRLVKAGGRTLYPLRLIQARRQVAGRVVVIGNAAHTLHPVAGQGFNLGLRDVAALAETLADARRDGRDPGSREVLGPYARARAADQRSAALLTDGLVRLFSPSFPPLALARGIGLVALDLLPPAKRAFARTTMGLGGRLPRLARGLDL